MRTRLKENGLLDQFHKTPGLVDAVVRAIDVDGENNIEFREVTAPRHPPFAMILPSAEPVAAAPMVIAR